MQLSPRRVLRESQPEVGRVARLSRRGRPVPPRLLLSGGIEPAPARGADDAVVDDVGAGAAGDLLPAVGAHLGRQVHSRALPGCSARCEPYTVFSGWLSQPS